MIPKHPVDSKTLWCNLILAILAIYRPGIEHFCLRNPSALPLALAGANIILRFLTREALHFNVPIYFFGLVNKREDIDAQAPGISNTNKEKKNQ